MIKSFAMVVLAVVTLASCTKVPAGNVGIKFYLLGKDKGVDYDVLSPGRYYVGMNENLYLFPTQNQTKIWTSDKREGSPNDDDFNFQSKAGLKLSASVSIEYHVKPENVPSIFEKYKTGLDEVTNRVLRNALRDAFNMASSTRTAEQMYGEGKIAFMTSVDSLAKIESTERGITIDDIFLVGNIVVPESITNALNAKVAADQLAQQKETELRATIADAQKVSAKATGEADAIIKLAEAQAKANRIVAMSLTSTLVEYNKIEKWDGKLPTVTGGAIPLLDMKK
jgi:regulator of protease activity HflC (stomatin/prohibitin superfamily)